jgi:hypothetical protein
VDLARPALRSESNQRQRRPLHAQFGATLEQLVRTGRTTDVQLIDMLICDGADMRDTDQFAHSALFEVT